MNGQIFISYRRNDSLGSTGRLYDRLIQSFKKEQIFMDVDDIQLGEDFLEAIEKAIGQCNILIAVIGIDWLNITDKRNGKRMLDNPLDFVRIEIRTALHRKIKVIPVLVENATMPTAEDLPDDLKPLSLRHCLELSHTRFNSDVDRLIKSMQLIFNSSIEGTNVQLKLDSTLLEQQKNINPIHNNLENSILIKKELPKPAYWLENFLLSNNYTLINTSINWKQFCESYSPLYPIYTYRELLKRGVSIPENLSSALNKYAIEKGYLSFESLLETYNIE